MDERLEEIKEWHENDGEMHQFQIDWLIEQAEQNYRIQKENAKLSIMLRTAQSDLFDIQQQNQRYKEALEFYADENNHRKLIIDGDTMYLGRSIAEEDSGEKARQALRGEST
ncbi:hypothetical protein [Oceanobacillus neutriphilus]|uniref:Uncharacterized protein n=1 Tax=Oceanobacillus neutriphilus TaxID=531815 RepID=A0ABQ2P2D3_9BACI|nr:hypothetical protein [Oceanobacillus neutriphilus]GGP16287.1 hypothetical protein GCM10011346_47660 [Oceanobacillus neutriphilus]